MMINGGSLDGTQILSPKTVELMTRNQLPDNKDLPSLSRSHFSEVAYNGICFVRGVSGHIDPVKTMIPRVVCEYSGGRTAWSQRQTGPMEV